MTARAVARARLRYEILAMLHDGLALAKTNYAFISAYTGTPERRVRHDFEGDGNLDLNTVAKYLDAMGLEVRVSLVGWRVDAALDAEDVAIAEQMLPAGAEVVPEWTSEAETPPESASVRDLPDGPRPSPTQPEETL